MTVESLRADSTQEDRFHLAMLHSPIGMAIVAPDGRFLEVNDALCSILGRSAEEVRAATWQDLTHPDDLQTDGELVARLLADEADSYQLPKRYLTPTGDVVHCQLSVVAVRASDRSVDFFISQLSDLSEGRAIAGPLPAHR